MADDDGAGLPVPVAAEFAPRRSRHSLRDTVHGRAKKTTTFQQGEKKSLRVRWQELKKIISTAVSLTDSPLDATVESTEASSFRAAIVRRESDWAGADDELVVPVEVNEVVVDAEWDLDKWANASTTGRSESAVAARQPSQGGPGTHSGRAPGSGRSQTGHTHGVDSSGIRDLWGLMTLLRWRLYPSLVRFFDLSYYSAYQEDKYRKDVWFTQKTLAVFAALFYFVILLLNAVIAAYPFDLFNKITVIGGGLLFSIPVLLCVLFNVPRMKLKYSWPYQVVLMFCTWSWAWYNIFDLWSCGFLASTYHPACGQKDFQLTSFYSTALPLVALFALNQNRFFHLLGVIGIEVLGLVLVLPVYHPWGRNFVNTTIFHALMLYVHYTRETAERRSFTLREQLKEQCRATQKAQVNERKEGDSKKRFVSYIFHEVRVPLNTALLAAQNLVGSGQVDKEEDLEFSALEGSLKMMSKVLNDVLDFNRMDSGRFTTVSKPYCFHNAIRSMLLPLELSAKSRGLDLTVTLDPKIDEAANRAAYPPEEYDKISAREGMVLGDEMRLRQIVTNLTSNACKFTPEGGQVHVETKLLLPQLSAEPSSPPELLVHHSEDDVQQDLHPGNVDPRQASPVPLSHIKSTPTLSPSGPATNLMALYTPMSGRSEAGVPHRSCIVVRIEVQDTGVGIRSRDLIDNRLFSPYVQTEIGRFQGGKGTGLGLALVRNIVKLSGGRLGVKSKVGEGSTFWVELALGVGPQAALSRQAPGNETRDTFYGSRASAAQGNLPRFRETEGITIIDYAPGIPRPDTPLLDNFDGPSDSVLLQASQPPPLNRERSTPAPSDALSESTALCESTRSPASEHPKAFQSGPNAETALPAAPPRRPALEGPKLDTPASPSEGGEALRQTLQNATGDGPALLTGSLPSGLPQLDKPSAGDGPVPVLVVDDDLLTRRLMARMLTRIGCTVDVAENGQVALDCLLGPSAAQLNGSYRHPSSTSSKVLLTPSSDLSQEPVLVDEHKYSVVFLDNQMPVLSGVQVVSRLRELGRSTFVVGVTGNALKEDQEEYLDAGVDRILTKPVLEKDLRNVVALASERRKQQHSRPP